MNRRLLISLSLSLSLLAVAGGAQAQATFPSKLITIVAPYPPGGTADVVARIVAERMKDILGQPVIVDNRTGASGSIGTAFVARAPADGYTLLAASQSHTTNGFLYSNIPWDPIKSFAPVTLVGVIPNVIAVHSSSPIKSLRELVATAKERPGRINYASAGVGTSIHLTAEMLKNSTGISMVHIPYKSDADSFAGLRGGDVQMAPLGLAFAKPWVDNGEVRALAVTTPKRSRLLPNVPTAAEAGFPNVDVRPWYAFLAPAGTPPAVIAKLNSAIATALKSPDIESKLLNLGIELEPGTPDDLTRFLRADMGRWEKVIKQAGIKLE